MSELSDYEPHIDAAPQLTDGERTACIDEIVRLTGEDRARLEDKPDLYLTIRRTRARELARALPPRERASAPHADAMRAMRDSERAARERMNRDMTRAWTRTRQSNANADARPYRQPAPRRTPPSTASTANTRERARREEDAARRAMERDMARGRRGQ